MWPRPSPALPAATAESVRGEIEVVNACLALEGYEEAAERLRKVRCAACRPVQVQVQLVGDATHMVHRCSVCTSDHLSPLELQPLPSAADGLPSLQGAFRLLNLHTTIPPNPTPALQVVDSPYQVQLVGGAGPLQASALQTMLNDIRGAAESHQQAQMRWVAWHGVVLDRNRRSETWQQHEIPPSLDSAFLHSAIHAHLHMPQYCTPSLPACLSCCSVRRRQGLDGERVLFRAGQVMRHKRYGYR